MAYVRKTTDEWTIQGYYGSQYGYEDVSAYDNRKEAMIDLRLYRQNERGTSFRLIKRRVRKDVTA